MKLNTKRTLLVGFAFFLICAFWQAYDTIVPLILTNKFGMAQGPSGIVMSLDNIFALFMLPLFGAMSDKFHSRFGKRTPFIFVGTIFGALFLALLGKADSLWFFLTVLLLSLLSMALFRSPAVALMPDVTPKPLRSQANAVINLMGTAGGMLVLGLGIVMKTSEAGKTDFFLYLLLVAILMLVALAAFLLTVKEPAWAKEAEAVNEKLDAEEKDGGETGGKDPHKLSKGELRSLYLILASVALWYVGYNAVTSKYSVYASDVLNVSYSLTLLLAQGAAIVSYIPVGIIASKFGRKKTILAGVLMLTCAFLCASFIRPGTPNAVMYLLFALAGIGWATINVNSFPMVVELAKNGDVGKFTGYYYTASMAAQIVTPIFSGYLVDLVGWWVFFPYAAFFVFSSFVTMFFTKHGDSKPEEKKNVLENFDVDAD